MLFLQKRVFWFSTIVLATLMSYHLCFAQQSAQNEALVPTQPETLNAALLSLECLYSGLPVYIDNDSVGVTPLQQCLIDTGLHRTVVPSPYRTRWYQQHWQRSFKATSGQHYRFKVSFPRMYLINTIPFGAEVFANGKKLGTTPITVFAAPESLVHITITKHNFRKVTLQLGEQEEGEIRLSLEYIDGWQEQNAQEGLVQQQRIRRKRRGLYSSIAFSTIAGLSTIYFRNQADDEYATYMHAGTPADMQHYYNRTKQYDKVAGISYALFQIGFVLTGYFFLTSRGE